MPRGRQDPRSKRQLEAAAIRSQLKLVLIAWLFGSYWLWSISGATLTRFAREAGTPDWGFGLMASLPHAGALFQLLATFLVTRFGHRKRIFMGFAIAARLSWVVLASLPWWLPVSPELSWIAMLATLIMAWVCHHISAPPWISWMADVIPSRMRGRYFGLRRLAGQPVALVAILLSGYLLDHTEFLNLGSLGETAGLSPVMTVASLLLAAGGIVGAIDILCFTPVTDPSPPKPTRNAQMFRLIVQALRDRMFRRFLAVNAFFTFAVGMIGQYVWLFFFDELGFSNQLANVLLLGIPIIIAAYMFPFWGRVLDRYGSKHVLIIAGCMAGIGGTCWLIVTPDRFWPGYVISMFSTCAWPGIEMATLNLIMDMSATPGARSRAAKRRAAEKQATDESNHADTPHTEGATDAKGKHTTDDDAPVSAGTVYVAVNSVVVATSGICAGLLAAWIASTYATLRFEVPMLGTTFTYHGILFLASVALRLIAVGWACTLHEPKHNRTLDALRYVGGSLYSNMVQAVLTPPRTVGRVARWTWRVSPLTDDQGRSRLKRQDRDEPYDDQHH